MLGVRKRIAGKCGETRLGLLRVAFDVDGNALRYHRPFSGFVDLVEPAGEVLLGRATFRGHEFGRFELRRNSCVSYAKQAAQPDRGPRRRLLAPRGRGR
jgi:hypothetical protein